MTDTEFLRELAEALGGISQVQTGVVVRLRRIADDLDTLAHTTENLCAEMADVLSSVDGANEVVVALRRHAKLLAR